MSEKYLPSNGTSGAAFIDDWCSGCARDKVMNGSVQESDCSDGDYCEILSASFRGEVDEWIYGEDGAPRCTAFVQVGEKVPEVDTLTIDMFVPAKSTPSTTILDPADGWPFPVIGE